ncbi:MAG: A/G-specific adenine glycosylase [Bacteroidales bacterium]|nr:A/G-specific adenine glycosylase [Bacteroidales bacterium]
MNLSPVLAKWYLQNKRDLPWRYTSSPYKIWLSEIILQQTRVDQGIEYYHKFLRHYPSLSDLSKATLDEILNIWQGLGYYSRARHLHETARKIVNEYGGRFPENYSELIKLKGVGPYTAAAIASIAFNEPVAVIDGNVYRVLARFFGLDLPVSSTEGRLQFEKLANSILDHNNPGMHNQAIMEFGAIQCVPLKPDCGCCPLRNTCHALLNNKIKVLPVKKTKARLKERYFNYLVITSGNKIILRKRTKKDIWKMLYEFPLIETPVRKSETEIINSSGWKEILENTASAKIINTSKLYEHTLTHQKLYVRFFRIIIDKSHFSFPEECIPVDIRSLKEYAVPKLIERYMEDYAMLH